MSELRPEDFDDVLDQEMTVTLELDEGQVVCSIFKIFTVDDKDYIALVPLEEDGTPTEDVWFYGYKENPDDPNEEPELIYISDDDELEAVLDRFDEMLDELEFEEGNEN